MLKDLKNRAYYVGQAYLLTQLLIEELNLKWADSLIVSDSFLLGGEEKPFEHITHIKLNLLDFREDELPFRYNKGTVRLASGPYISIGRHFNHGTLNIQGSVRTQFRPYRHKYFNETDFTFLNYGYVSSFNYQELFELAKKNFKPDVLKTFISKKHKEGQTM